MRAIRACLEYDGTGYSGWQVQPNARTIQAEVEEALHNLTRERTRVHAAGRTDAGVHALGQVMSFTTETTIPADRFAPGLNRFLPAAIRVLWSDEVPSSFHARYSASGKVYEYRAMVHRGLRPLVSRYCWLVWPEPDVEVMRAAAEPLAGEHDFAAFAASGRMPGSTVKTLERVVVESVAGATLGPALSEDRALRFEFEGTGFLYKMVRNIVGTLVEIGRGARDPADVVKALETGDPAYRGATAPPEGLVLVRVLYPPTG